MLLSILDILYGVSNLYLALFDFICSNFFPFKEEENFRLHLHGNQHMCYWLSAIEYIIHSYSNIGKEVQIFPTDY